MPIYEFYCSHCHTLYSFFSRTANTDKVPRCPKCLDVVLERRMSVFATVSGKAKDEVADDPFSALDEKKVEKELAKLAGEAEKIKDDDPHAAAQLMRKFTDMTGIKLGDGFQEALKRMEKGEDPEKIEEEMGDILAEEEYCGEKQSGKKASRRKVKVDETLYDL
jgi:putative FmdB family regulatory protein